MSKFTNKRKKELLKNKYILTFSKDHIIYTEEFRKKVIMDLSNGKRILDIFENCGLNPNEIGLSSIKANKHNWSKEFKIINNNGKRRAVRIKGAYPILNNEGRIKYVTVENGKLVDDYTEDQIKELSQNKYVEFVSKDKITFHADYSTII